MERNLTRQRAGTRKQLFLLTIVVVVFFSPNASTQQASADVSRRAAQVGPSVTKLRKIDRERLIAAKLQGKTELMLLLVAMPGANPALAQEVVKLGASIRFREDTVDYLRVKIPTNRVDDVARLSAVQVMALDGVQMYDTSQEIPVSDQRYQGATIHSRPPDVRWPRSDDRQRGRKLSGHACA
jgi:hypothetical protein